MSKNKKILQIVENAYRCTIEEQDDPILWLTAAMQGKGDTDSHVLLKGNAVNYAVRGQDASGLSFGGKEQTQPPKIDRDIGAMIKNGIDVYLVRDDAAERGLEVSELVAGIRPIARDEVAGLFRNYDFVWHW